MTPAPASAVIVFETHSVAMSRYATTNTVTATIAIMLISRSGSAIPDRARPGSEGAPASRQTRFASVRTQSELEQPGRADHTDQLVVPHHRGQRAAQPRHDRSDLDDGVVVVD